MGSYAVAMEAAAEHFWVMWWLIYEKAGVTSAEARRICLCSYGICVLNRNTGTILKLGEQEEIKEGTYL